MLQISGAGGWYEPDALSLELKSIERLYQDEGFLRARVGPPEVNFVTDAAKGRVAAIRVPVSEGSLFTLGQITLKYVEAFRPDTLLQMCPLKKGQAYSRSRIAQWQEKIEDGYRTLGYIRFESSLREDIREASHSVDCTLEFREGNPYSVGKITIEGSGSISARDFKRHLLVGEGGLYNPQLIAQSIYFLNQMGVYGRIRMTDVETRIDDARSTVDLVFHLSPPAKPRPPSKP